MLINKIIIGLRFLEVRVLHRKKPLVASFALTHRCNYHCLYCGSRDIKTPELSTKEVFLVIDELKRCGVLRVVFTGGEPLLREDIGDIIHYAKNKKLSVYMNTNGSLVPHKINQIKLIDGIQVSLEGSQKTHDSIRGEGSYKDVMSALDIINSAGIKLILASTINKFNVEKIDDIIEIARRFNTIVSFQPLTLTLLDASSPNPILPSLYPYRRCMKKLIELKRRGDPHIYNSLTGLLHLYNWPHTSRLLCGAGKLFFRIEADGRVFSCSRLQPPQEGKYIKPSFNLRKIIDTLGSVSCKQCWCAGAVEANLAYSLKLEPLFNLLRNRIA